MDSEWAGAGEAAIHGERGGVGLRGGGDVQSELRERGDVEVRVDVDGLADHGHLLVAERRQTERVRLPERVHAQVGARA